MSTALHPTQVLLHSPQALRIAYTVDSSELELWWSPKAGESFDYLDRNFSSRDDHLCIFDRITFPELNIERFAGCDYDPYDSTVRYTGLQFSLRPLVNAPALLISADRPLTIDFKSEREDESLLRDEQTFALGHVEAGQRFEFVATLGSGEGSFQHQRLIESGRSIYSRAKLGPGQPLVIAVDLSGRNAVKLGHNIARDASRSIAVSLEVMHSELRPGKWFCENQAMNRLQEITMAGLHSCIDNSGAIRASIKAVYYLIWVRDGAFCFCYQAHAGWPHRFQEWCRFMLENPTEVNEPGHPRKMFAQLVSKRFGKLEEDGIYYAIWSVFTYWTQTGDRQFVEGGWRDLLCSCMDEIENYGWDEARGLFGGHFTDESPSVGARDCYYDHAVGKPGGEGGVHLDGKPVKLFYDVYYNILMHASWSMLAIICEGEKANGYQAKADKLSVELAKFFEELNEDGLPIYSHLLFADGTWGIAPPFVPSKSVYSWALTLPSFARIPKVDRLRQNLLKKMMEEPDGHWINGIASAIAAIDTWNYDESMLVVALEKVCDQSMQAGTYFPMAGAMPEKFNAPMGNLHHDIRPQAFAQSSWLAACANLGVRRLHYGLAVRPTRYLKNLQDYQWQGRSIDFHFGAEGIESHANLGLEINGQPVCYTLQLPEENLDEAKNAIRFALGKAGPLLVRSSVRLNRVEEQEGIVRYHITSWGPCEMVFDDAPQIVSLTANQGESIKPDSEVADELHFLYFRCRGDAVLELRV